MENILRRSIPFFKPEQPFYTYSIDLLILQEGLRYLFFELRHVEHGQMCISGAFTKATTSATRAAIQCASRDPNRTTVVGHEMRSLIIRSFWLRWALAIPSTASSVA